jgi:hypothetical protein
MNKVARLTGVICRLFFLFVILIATFFCSAYAQQNEVLKEIKKEGFTYKLEFLRKEFAENKTFVPEYELQCLVALSYYPELSGTRIVFKKKRIITTMASRPPFKVIFQPDKTRTYNICISTKKNLKGALLTDVVFNEQIGVIGHELGHITDYINKSKWQLAKTFFGYLFFHKFKKKIEAGADMATINHGLGWQLYYFGDFIQNRSKVRNKYKKHKSRFYLSAGDILELLSKSPLYQDFFDKVKNR